ncbi:HNH endonuclease [Ralstonia sp. 25C]|uniref:HNH endonuclease n=1 Tax=Ralstonia sp. 25C TaxID=3447363 RepID=UPI003F75509D
MDPMPEATDFYEQNYRAVCAYVLRDSDKKKVILGSSANRKCRFCGKEPPEVSFKLEAHAIPESLGNKKIFSLYECDTCNKFFGNGIENDFGNWSKPARSLGRRRGKNGIPTLKGSGDSSWRMEWSNNQFSVTAGNDENDMPFKASDDMRTLTFELKRDPHTPIAVLKAFVKMALTIIPDEELPNFREALAWIKNPLHREEIPLLAPVLTTFTPGPQPIDTITVGVICRKAESVQAIPYAFLILVYGNDMFQVALPSPERDPVFESEAPVVIKPFPKSPSSNGPHQLYTIDLSNTEVIKDSKITSTMKFEQAIPSDLRDFNKSS